MSRKSLIGMIVGCLCMLLMLAVVLVGLVDGIWPWDGYTYYQQLDLDIDPVTGHRPGDAGSKDPAQQTDPDAEDETGINGEAAQNTSPTVPDENVITPSETVDVPTTGNGTTDPTDKDTVFVPGNDIPGF